MTLLSGDGGDTLITHNMTIDMDIFIDGVMIIGSGTVHARNITCDRLVVASVLYATSIKAGEVQITGGIIGQSTLNLTTYNFSWGIRNQPHYGKGCNTFSTT